MDEHNLPVSITLTVDEWRFVLAGLDNYYFASSGVKTQELNMKIASIVFAEIEKYQGKEIGNEEQ